MEKIQFDLEDRTFKFALSVRAYLENISVPEMAGEDKKQLMRSSGSIGANYIEANEALGRKDFVMRLRISLKETKESIYWLKLIMPRSAQIEITRNQLIQEAQELIKIFGAIISKINNSR